MVKLQQRCLSLSFGLRISKRRLQLVILLTGSRVTSGAVDIIGARKNKPWHLRLQHCLGQSDASIEIGYPCGILVYPAELSCQMKYNINPRRAST